MGFNEKLWADTRRNTEDIESIYSVGKNKVNESTVIGGIGIGNTGVIGVQATWGILYVPVDQQTQYTIKNASGTYFSGVIGALGYCNSEKVVLSYVDADTLPTATNGGKTFTTPLNCAFVATNLYVGDTSYDARGSLQIEIGFAFTGYEPYVPSKYDMVGYNQITNKKIIAIGDSMVKGHTLTDSQTWLSKLANRNGMAYVNHGINGCYMSNNGTLADSVYQRVTNTGNANYIKDVGVSHILVFALTNDAANAVTIGTSASTDVTTVYGSVKAICDNLQTRFPSAKIGFITPYNRNTGYDAYINALESACALYGIPVFNNMKNGGINWANTSQISALTLGDTYHLNEPGMYFASTKYEAFLKGM